MSVKAQLRQKLEELGPALAASLQTLRNSTDKMDLEVLRCLAEGTGTCRFKRCGNEEWTDSIPLSEEDERATLVRLFLLLLWQSRGLKQVLHDPLDLRVARTNRKVKEKCENSTQSDQTTEIVEENTEQDVGSSESTDESSEEEDGAPTPDYLIGPRHIDLKRIDSYHPLFHTYRKSTHIRKENFLNSKHISCARTLSGIDTYGDGYSFTRAVLEKAAPSLEQLDVGELREFARDPQPLDLLRGLFFPRLRRLSVAVEHGVDHGTEPLPALATGLRWLRAHLPRAALEPLVRANAGTLAELELTAGVGDDGLADLVAECGALRRLVLRRGVLARHTRASCAEQVAVLRAAAARAGLAVVCEACCSDREGPYVERSPRQRRQWQYQHESY